MATTRRDIELLISAKETTGRSFQQVTANIDALNAKIGEQVAAAQRGEVSLKELRQSQQELEQAGRDLSALQGQIDAYNRLVATSDKVGTSAEKARADLEALKATIESSGKATAAQERRQQRLENAVVRTSAAVEKNKTDLAEQTAVLRRAGVATDSLEQAQTGIVKSAHQIGAGLVQVNSSITDYSSNVAVAAQRQKEGLQAAREAEQAFAAEQTFQKKLDDASKLGKAADYTAWWVRALDAAEQAEAQFAAQQGFDKKVRDAQQLGQASKFVQLFSDAVQTVAVADNQLAALSGFRALGAQAVEASNDMSRFVETGQTMATTSHQVAAGLRALIDPGNQALTTLSGVETALEQADIAAAEGVKNVGALNDAYNQLSAAGAALLRQGGLVDSFRQQSDAADIVRAQFREAQAEVQRLGAAMAAADEPTEQLANALRQAEARLEQTGRALTQEEAKLGAMSRELKQAGINTSNLAAEQLRLEAAATRVNTSMETVNTTLGRGGRRTTGLFGLRPHDLANLNFQIQDIVVGLQSGQKPLTILFQQGSQISQIFPGLISSAAKLLLRWFPLLAIATALGAVFGELYSDTQRLKQAMEDLARLPTGGGLDPQRFADAQERLEAMGHSAEDARKAMLSLAEEGFDSDSLDTYSKAAAQLAERLGVDLTEASQMLIDVQRGGIDAVLDLAEKTNDLTEADLDHADALFEAGKAAEARQYILDRVADRNDQIAKATRSQWTPAVNNLKSAWESFSNWLIRVYTPTIDKVNKRINDTIIGLTYLTALLAGKGFAGAQADAESAWRLQQRGGGGGGAGASDQDIRNRRFAKELDAELGDSRELTKQERLRRAEVEARTRAQAAGVSKALEDRAVTQAVAAEQKKINSEAEKANKRGTSAANRAQRQAEAEQRKREAAQRQLEGQLRQLNRAAFSGISATLEERLDAINEKYATIADSLEKMRALGLSTSADGRSIADIERQVEATKQRLKAEETIKFYQEQAALLSKQREAEVRRVTDAQQRGAISTQQAMEQAAAITSRLSPQITQAAEKALAVAQSIAGTNPSPEMVSWIASLERLVSGESTNRTVADVGLEGFDETSARLDTLLKERDDLVRSYQTLFELGLKSEGEVRELTAQAYSRQAAAIQPVLAQLREQVELLHNTIDPLTQLPVISDTAYAAWLAKIAAVNAGLQNIDPRLTQINSAVRQSIQGGVVSAFNAAAQSIVGLIGGTQSFSDAIENLGQTALSIFGSMLDAIAQVLVQMVALQVANALLPGSGTALSFLFHDGGIVGGRGGSRQSRSGVSDSWIGAPKFHSGGGLGLRPDEYKAILQRGEEVLTDDDPRHIRNIGKGGGEESGGGGTGIKQVLLLDPAAVPNAMQSRSGQKSILTVIRQNKDTIKQVLG